MNLRRLPMLLLLTPLAGCGGHSENTGVPGDADAGKVALERFDCGVCHRIPGIRDARGRTGPSLDSYSGRVYVAGKIPNTPANLARWIQHPTALTPQTAMPAQGVNEEQARDMAAYLHTLE